MIKSTINTKIAILGGGPAGYVAAIRAAGLGAEVVLVEKGELGGVCLNVGCVPTKTLLKSSEFYNNIQQSKEFGIEVSQSKIDWNISTERKNRVVKNLNIGLENILPHKGINVLKGTGTIINSKKIIVATSDNEVEVNCEKLIIASGSEPLIPNIEGINSAGVITSTDALSLNKLPGSMAIIGGGAIGLEFATMFNSIGVKTTIIEMKDKILPNEDSELSTELMKIMKRKGISFKLSAAVKQIKKSEDGLEVIYSIKDKSESLTCENVLLAIGRKLNSESEWVKTLGLHIENGAVVVNDRMETNVDGVYAAGDIVGGKLLAHLAFMEGKTAAENALGINNVINRDAVPACVYTNPEIASVGISEEEAIKRGIRVKTGKFNLKNNGRALSLGEREGFVKIIADENNTIIGGQIMGHNASEIISEVTLAITLKAKADLIADMIHPHPSLSEAIWEACAEIAGRSIHK
jgi:dihydrolipoamide dehydrogenase